MHARTHAPALALALGLSLAACSGPGDRNESDPGEGDHLAGSPGGNRTALPSDDASASGDDGAAGGADANAAAVAAIGAAEGEAGGTAFSIDDADDDDTWEVDVAVGDGTVTVKVDQAGEVAGTAEDDLNPAVVQALDAAQVSLADAVESVLAEADGTLDDAELEEEDGNFDTWSVTVDEQGDAVDYRVDVASGEVVRD
jgi:uncharacterized membrane protein YkoI